MNSVSNEDISRKAQRTLKLKKIWLFNIVRSVRMLRDIIVSIVECIGSLSAFQQHAADGMVSLTNAMLIQSKQISDLNMRINKLEGKQDE